MLVTLNSTCDSIRIESSLELFQEKIDSTDEILISLEIYKNCSTTPSNTIDIVTTVVPNPPSLEEIEVENDGNNFITLVPGNLIEDSTKFSTDIMFIKLISVNQSTNTTKTEQSCLVLTCDLKCVVVNFLLENVDCTDAGILYKSLELSQDCPECSCDDTCIIYNKLIDILNKDTDVKCGCTSSPEVLAIY